MIVVMETEHRAWMLERYPESANRCHLLSEFAQTGQIQKGSDVPDAIGEQIESFRDTYRIIRDCVDGLLRSLPTAPEETYVQAVEERLRDRRPSPLTLSTAEYGIVERWWKQAVPLWLILETIDEVAGRESMDGARKTRLTYCAPIVEERFAAWQRTRVAPARQPIGGQALLTTAKDHLDEAAARVDECGDAEAARHFRRAADDLSALDPAMEGSEIRLHLDALEQQLVDSLRSITPPDLIHDMDKKAGEQLAGYRDRMTDEAFLTTRRRLVDKLIRARYGVPELSSTST